MPQLATPVLCACLGAAMLAAVPARADVIEVGDDGAVRTRGGGGDVQWVRADATGDAPGEDAPEVPAIAVTEIAAPVVPAGWSAPLARVAGEARLSPDLLAALVTRESGWRAGAVSDRGAIGLAQLMPATARGLRVDPRDPAANLAGGARYLRLMLDRFDGDVERALAAYNAGPGRIARGTPAPAGTRAYVSAILDRLTPAPAVPPAGAMP